MSHWDPWKYDWDPFRLIPAQVDTSADTPLPNELVGASPAAWNKSISAHIKKEEQDTVVPTHGTAGPSMEDRAILSFSKRPYDRVTDLDKMICQVKGCNKSLISEKPYYKRYRVCPTHLNMSSLLVYGVPSRFCQQCGRFHPVTDFNDERRSCRARLSEHNARRRKRNKEKSRAGGGGDELEEGEDSGSLSKRSSALGSVSSSLHRTTLSSQPLPRKKDSTSASQLPSVMSQWPSLDLCRAATEETGRLPPLPEDLLHLLQGTRLPKESASSVGLLPLQQAGTSSRRPSRPKASSLTYQSQPLPQPAPNSRLFNNSSNQAFLVDNDMRHSGSGAFDFGSRDLDFFLPDETEAREQPLLLPFPDQVNLPFNNQVKQEEEEVEELEPWTSTEEAYSWLNAATAPTSEPNISPLLLLDEDQEQPILSLPQPSGLRVPSSSSKHQKAFRLPMLPPDLSTFPPSSGSSMGGTEPPSAPMSTTSLPTSTFDLARTFVAAGASEEPPPYYPQELLVRVSIKVANCTPDQLPPTLFARLQSVLSTVDASVVQGYLRPGCCHLVLDVRLHGRRGEEVDPGGLAWACLGEEVTRQQVEVQVDGYEEERGGQREVFKSNEAHKQLSSDGHLVVDPPRLTYVSPLATLALQGSSWSTSFIASAANVDPMESCRFLVRMHGGYLPVRSHEIEAEEMARVDQGSWIKGGRSSSRWFRIELPFAPGPGLGVIEMESKGSRLSNWLPILLLPSHLTPLPASVSSLPSHLLIDIGHVMDHLYSVVHYYHTQQQADDDAGPLGRDAALLVDDDAGPLGRDAALLTLHKADKVICYLSSLQAPPGPLLSFMHERRAQMASLCHHPVSQEAAVKQEKEKEKEALRDGSSPSPTSTLSPRLL